MAILEVMKKNKETIYRLVIIAALIILSLVIVERFTPPVNSDMNEMLARLIQHSEIQPYSNYSVEIGILTAEELPELAKTQPVVYADLKPGLYQITFVSEKDSLLVIYDNENNAIIRMFHINYF